MLQEKDSHFEMRFVKKIQNLQQFYDLFLPKIPYFLTVKINAFVICYRESILHLWQ
jgi:hypothetical protein